METLHARRLLHGSSLGASDPLPWFDPGAITYSFAPDGTEVAGTSNRLFSVLDQIADSTEWQAQVDAALDAWLEPLGVSGQRVSDSGSRFGIAGRTQGDTRFGDIRFAAIPLSDNVFATSIPHSTVVQGTWAGDVILNSNATWNNLQEVFAVAFHELGHVLGLEHSLDPRSPMFVHGVHDVTAPTEEDLETLLMLYNGIEFKGEESSGSESSGKSESGGDQFASAIPLSPVVGTTIRYTASGSIENSATPRIYRLEPTPSEAGSLEQLNVAVQSVGRNRLIAEVEIFNEDGDPVDSQVLHHSEGAIVVQARNINNEQTYFVQVRSADTSPSYQIGDFDLVADYGPKIRESREIGDLRINVETPTIEQSFAVASSRFVHLHFDAESRGGPGSRIWATLFNSSGQQITQATFVAGESRSMPLVFLPPDNYSIRLTTRESLEIADGETRVNVFVDEISLDVGPGVSNPTGEPYLWCNDPDANPSYCYEYTEIDVSEPTEPDPYSDADLDTQEWWVYSGYSCDDYPPEAFPFINEYDSQWWDFYVEVCQGVTNPPPTNPPPTNPPPTNPPPTNPPPTNPPPTNPPPTNPPPTNPPPTNPPPTNPSLSPWQNRSEAHDVSGNSVVSAQDALIIINLLSRSAATEIPVTEISQSTFADVNGDFKVTASDAFIVINALSRVRAVAEQEMALLSLFGFDGIETELEEVASQQQPPGQLF